MQSISFLHVAVSLYLALVIIKLWVVRDAVTLFSEVIHYEFGAYKHLRTSLVLTWIIATGALLVLAWLTLIVERRNYFVRYPDSYVLESAIKFGQHSG